MRGLLRPLIYLVIFLVVTSIATVLLGETISNANGEATYSYKAVFDDATSLNVGDDVRVAGVRVGTVGGLKIIRDNGQSYAQVSFSVSRSRTLPMCTQVSIKYRNLIGQRYLDVAQNGDYTCDQSGNLKPGDVVPVTHTVDALDLTQLFANFQPLFQGLDPTEINQLSQEVIQTLQGEGGTIDTLVTTVGQLTNTLADHDQVIGDLITNLSSVLGTVAQHNQQLNDLVTNLQTFISGLSQDRNEIADSIDGVNRLATSTSGLLTQARPYLKTDIVKLTDLAALLNANGGDLASAIQNTPLIAGELTRTASYGSWFNFYLCQASGTVTLPVLGTHAVNVNLPSGPRCNGT